MAQSSRWARRRAWMVAETKKCCCLRRSSLPSYVRSSGYSTLLSVSARCFDRMACAQQGDEPGFFCFNFDL